ncbi:hypothetical protein PF010_g27666 [Phytophthora fragariae]|uniref:Aminotransferase class I/classII large domain-containing protein n=1 Tax=Phytophthora fragariae TaxID=53985 RepID=A0A6G0QAZ1_9STRA|nr:hypothetical protein PF010_g27666 [Phytophthora fragariae]KAE9172691.1 hypothetical protein PF004_g27200 [Phytophthora fragariae]KAE9278495.1 hypothetical protein PF008_g28607 [Phytophthora fragariae]
MAQKFEGVSTAESTRKTGRLETGTNIIMTDKYPLNPMFQKVAVAKKVLTHGQTKQMDAEGKQVGSLCVGEPDYNPHQHMQAAGAKATSEGNIKPSASSTTRPSSCVYAEPIPLHMTLEENYLINPHDCEKTLMTQPDVKAITLCNPSNPTGTLHRSEHLERIAAVPRKPQFRHIVVVLNEIYEQLLY